jgi:large subunit ribosomal protein L24
VISGSHKGTEAKIVKVDPKAGKAYLEGIGVVERHVRKSYVNPTGGKRTVHLGIDMSNLKLVESAEPAKAKKNDKKADKKVEKKAKKGAK